MRRLTVSSIAVLAALLVSSVAPAGPVANTLVLNLDENSGTTTDDQSFHDNDGTLLGGATWTTGQFGSAIYFDGTSGSVETTLTQAQPLPLSVEAWVKTTDDSGSIVNKYQSGSYNGFQVFMNSSHLSAWYAAPPNRISRTDNLSTVTALQIADGNWHHTVTVFDPTGTTHYVDGALAASVGWTGTPGNSTETTPLRLGRYGTGTASAHYLDGTIDGVAIYDRVLDLADVQARYNDGPPVASPVPGANILCLNLDEGQGTTTRDSWTGQNATLHGTDAADMWTASGKFDAALQFDRDKSQYVETQLTNAQAPPLTIEAWVKGDPSITSGHLGIVNKYQSSSMNGFQLFASSGNLAAWYYTSSTNAAAYSSSPLNDDLWHHVAAVFDEDGTEIFHDGVSVGHANWSNGMGLSSESTPLRLGAYPTAGTPGNFFDGFIDEVALYGRALTAGEIRTRFEDGPPLPAPEPGSLLLLLIGFGILTARPKRRKA